MTHTIEWGCHSYWKMIARWDDLPYSSISYTFNIYLVGGFNPSEKYESQLGLLFQKMEK
jgi:hypothetical protein